MFVDFYGSSLEHDESVFIPTTITKFAALKIPVEGKKVLDLGCGIGPLAIYYAKNGADSVTAADVYDRHVEYTKWNAMRNDVDIEVIQSDTEVSGNCLGWALSCQTEPCRPWVLPEASSIEGPVEEKKEVGKQ